MRLLYVEDNPFDADMLRRSIERLEAEITLDIVPSLSKAREALQRDLEIDVLLTDLRLPDGSGLDLLYEARQQRPGMAFIVLTGAEDTESAAAALHAGADDYILKESDYLERLPQILDAARSRHRWQTELQRTALRVLYVENDIDDLVFAQQYCARHAPHLSIEGALTAEEALERLPDGPDENCDFDLLLIDYQLTGLDGLELARIVAEQRKLDLPMVLLTGVGTVPIITESLRVGVDGYLVKHPGYLTELPSVIEKSVRQREVVEKSRALRKSRRQLEHMLENSPTVLYAMHVDGLSLTREWVSDSVLRIFGYRPEEVMAEGWWREHLHPEDADTAASRLESLFVTRRWTNEYRLQHAGGHYVWVRDEMRMVPGDESGDPDTSMSVIGSWSDITNEYRSRELLRLGGKVIDSTQESVLITDTDGNIITANPAFCEITGYSITEVAGKNPNILSSGRQDRDFYQAMWHSLKKTHSWQGEVWNRRKSGEIFPQLLTINAVVDKRGTVTHYVGVGTDLTQLRRSEEKLQHLSHYDPLTDLPNRLLLISRIDLAIRRANRQQQRVGVLMFDLYEFRRVNEAYGYTVGDELILAFARRLQHRVRRQDTFGRLQGDMFVLLIEEIDEPAVLANIAQEMLKTLETPFETKTDSLQIKLTANVGIAIFPDDSSTPEGLLQDAEAALPLAKRAPESSYAFYAEELTRDANRRMNLEADLRKAIELEQFELHYQPFIDLTDSDRVKGAEALIRWRRDGELVFPNDFIEAAEESGLILKIGVWVLRTACLQAKAWLDAGADFGVMAVNLCSAQLHDEGIVELVAAVLKETGLPPEHLELELTERGLMKEGYGAIEITQRLRTIGCKIAIDDFGTGYSSLAYLKKFSIDKLKIDRSFVMELPDDAISSAIADAVIVMSKALGMEVLAEGVETEEQLEWMRAHNCQSVQGYFFSRPVPPDEFATRLLGL